MVALLVFITAALEFLAEKSRWTQRAHLAVTFSKIRLHIIFIHFFLPGVDGLFSQARRLDHELHQCPQKRLHSFLVISLSERVQLV